MQVIDGRQTIETNLAKPGATTSSLLDQLTDDETVAALRSADMVLVTIGANDFEDATESTCAPGVSMTCFAPTLPAMSSRLGEILTKLRNLSNARVVVTGYWNVFLDGQQARAKGAAYVRDADKLTRQVNSVIEKRAGLGGALFADLYTAFKGDGDQDDTPLLAPDGDHPNAQGHQVIAHVIDMQLGV
jgi:lysophospholipase L1-like esterase